MFTSEQINKPQNILVSPVLSEFDFINTTMSAFVRLSVQLSQNYIEINSSKDLTFFYTGIGIA